MALTLVATPGAANANTYLTKAEASSVGGYIESRLFKTNWTSATVANRNTALVQATRIIDDWFSWQGVRANEAQALDWPRYNAYDCDDYSFDGDEIPQALKDATAELAYWLLSGTDVTTKPDTLGFSRIKVDVLELDVDKADRDGDTVVPDIVASMVECFGALRRRGTGGVAKLVRA